ncbi:hypothetical protein BKA67DRAFT_573979 [Truncatella angustata]|uniref:Rhodopsin domain-containing protein n=1 Tax=Truncatella angustata TaxID=152316 RepID=A0A9P8UHW7_9PEZI|nr:uncharacterized protein BKA67DRAFT_573979 [Truncatella angustata]KAH6652430.1 hypothetical protein BKA67DRAFT_573979 [Truncatella angustata]
MEGPSSVVSLPKDDSYVPECFAWYTVGVLVILLRFATRVRTVGLSGFRGDDYLAILYIALYTTCIIIVYVTYYTGASLNIDPSKVDLLTDNDIRILVMGSRIEYASFFIYVGCIWTLKFSVLYFYNRITLGVLRRKTVMFLWWFCIGSFFVVCTTALCSCYPVQRNWQVRPLPSGNCTYRPQNFVVLAVFNVLSDAALMSIPIPIMSHLRVTTRRKIGISILLSSGVFVISTAVIRVVLTLIGEPTIITINLWGFRELGVGLIAVTAPIVYPMFTPEFWRAGPYVRQNRRNILQASLNISIGSFKDDNDVGVQLRPSKSWPSQPRKASSAYHSSLQDIDIEFDLNSDGVETIACKDMI